MRVALPPGLGFALCVALAGCGASSGAATSGGGVGERHDSSCKPDPAMPAFVQRHLAILPRDSGLDLDGDGTVDNALSVLAPLANPIWEEQVSSGATLMVITYDGLTAPLADGAKPEMALFLAVDDDVPADASNDFEGSGRFRVPAGQYDVSCRPTTSIDGVTAAGGVLTGRAPRLELVAQRFGTYELLDVVLTSRPSQPDADGRFTRTDGVLAGTLTICGLSRIPLLTDGSSTLLDLVVRNFALAPDVDGDGDGFERIVADASGAIASCVDGDGTPIAGHECVCDPRIQDRYSVAFEITGVPARLVDVVTDQ